MHIPIPQRQQSESRLNSIHDRHFFIVADSMSNIAVLQPIDMAYLVGKSCQSPVVVIVHEKSRVRVDAYLSSGQIAHNGVAVPRGRYPIIIRGRVKHGRVCSTYFCRTPISEPNVPIAIIPFNPSQLIHVIMPRPTRYRGFHVILYFSVGFPRDGVAISRPLPKDEILIPRKPRGPLPLV